MISGVCFKRIQKAGTSWENSTYKIIAELGHVAHFLTCVPFFNIFEIWKIKAKNKFQLHGSMYESTAQTGLKPDRTVLACWPSCLHFPSAGNTGMHCHIHFYVVLGTKSRASWLSQHSTNWVIVLAPSFFFLKGIFKHHKEVGKTIHKHTQKHSSVEPNCED